MATSFTAHAVAQMTMAANYTVQSNDNLCYKIGDVVFYALRAYNSGTPANNAAVLTFPVGYRPNQSILGVASIGYQGDHTDVVYIGTDGVMKIGSPVNNSATTYYLRLVGHFPTALIPTDP